MTFDSSPVSQATPTSALNTAPSTNGNSSDASGGMTFDAGPVTTPLIVPATANQPTQPTGVPHNTITATPGSMPGDSLPSKITLWAQSLRNDLMHGTQNTDIGRLYKSIGGQPLANGQGEAVGEFMGSPLLGPTRVIQGASELPQTGRRWQGTKDVVGGVLDTSTIPGGFVAPEAGELAGTGSEAALDAAGNVAKAAGRGAKNLFSLQAVQDALEGSHADIQKALESGTQVIQGHWHQTVRDLFDRVAQDAGVTPEKAESLHDVAANVSDAIKAKAQSLYKQADAAVGGTRFQSYQDAVKNIRNAIREEVGLDPERDAQLQKRLADAQAGHDAAKETLAAKGLDPGIIDTADALWKQGSALGDLSKPIQSSISGLRADLQGAGAAAESLSPAKLAARVNALYDRGRLQQALGDGGADELLTAMEDTKSRLKNLANGAKQQAQAVKTKASQEFARVQANRTTAKIAAGAALGGVPGYALLKHLLGL
ncbi:MAG: hypothetical protein M3O02_03910 [Acidobacteriota bacterium]|nr:hypothetical protein [Acidobacteriota bacterium]